jgi:hypothetical protein
LIFDSLKLLQNSLVPLLLGWALQFFFCVVLFAVVILVYLVQFLNGLLSIFFGDFPTIFVDGSFAVEIWIAAQP